ncbi:MAG: DNA cytosine methyltransferase, partial [Planctomycetia bacterium]|nr:DNA cytosine methyltransferase [Planctomycetia bacterium]
MENVPGMLAGATRAVLDDAVARFESYGYRVVHPVRVLDASLFGVPQKRRRLIVMGIREDLPGTLEYPDGPPDSFPDRPTVWEAIGDLPDVDADEELFALNNARYTKKPASDYAKLMRGAMLDPADFSYPRNWDGSHCTGCLRVRHTPSAIALYTATRAGDMVPGHKLPRLDPAGIAPTLRAGSDSTHGSYTAPRPIHPHRPRCITAREAARLHGYPDWFDFYPLKWHAYRQIGNSVCPPVARALGMSLMKALELEPTRPTKTLVMNDEYRLPPERPRSLKRIPQVLHFPPVIAHLFADRFNDERQTLTNGKFTFEEVKRAVGETGVQLTWIRPDTFLSEISRSRNVRKLLDPCLRRGYTIRKCNDKKYIGEFVPVGHEEGIEVKAKADRSSSISRRRKDVARGQKPLFT